MLTHYDQKKANQQFVEELLKECKIKVRSQETSLNITTQEIQIDGLIISRLQNVKFLGIMINEFLNWNIHITDICKRLAKNIGLLFKLKYLLPKNVLFMIYNSLVYHT